MRRWLAIPALLVLLGILVALVFQARLRMAQEGARQLIEKLGCHEAVVSISEIKISGLRLPKLECTLATPAGTLQFQAQEIFWSFRLRELFEKNDGGIVAIKTLTIVRTPLEPTLKTKPTLKNTAVENSNPIATLEMPLVPIAELSLKELSLSGFTTLPLRLQNISWNRESRSLAVKILDLRQQLEPLLPKDKENRFALHLENPEELSLQTHFPAPLQALSAGLQIETSDTIGLKISWARQKGKFQKELRLLFTELKINTLAGALNAQFTAKDPSGFLMLKGSAQKALLPEEAPITWKLQAHPLEFSVFGNTLKKFLASPELPYEIHSGKISLEAIGKNSDFSANAKLSDVGGYYGEFVLGGLNLSLEMRALKTALRISPTPLRFKSFRTFAWNAEDIELSFTGTHFPASGKKRARTRAQLSKLKMKTLGGTAKLDTLEWNNTSQASKGILEFSEIDLVEILKLKQHPGLSATGRITGALPFIFDKSIFAVNQGQARAISPGTIRYQPAEDTNAIASSNYGLQLALGALSDFRYSNLESTVDFQPTGILKLGLRITGNNPTFHNGKTVNFNVNVEENLWSLLQSLRIGDDLGKSLETRMQR